MATLAALFRGIWQAFSQHVDSTVHEAEDDRRKNPDWFAHR